MRSPTPTSTLPARGLKPLLKREPVPPATPEKRGYAPVHTTGCRCPGCGRSHWHIGRMMAECGFCETAIPLAEGGTTGTGLFQRRIFGVAA